MTIRFGVAALALLLGTPAVAAAQDISANVARAKAMIDHLVAGEPDKVAEHFNARMKAGMPVGRLAAMWIGLIVPGGAFKNCETSERVVNIGDRQMVIRTCFFERGKADIQFAFDTEGKISGLTFRPAFTESPHALPPYATPAAYSETNVSIGSGDWILPGVLTMPVGGASVPAVVLVHGSGPHDRDATLAGSKPFRDLAVGLASRGVAVLRYDKRSQVHAGKLAAIKNVTVQHEVIDDVVQAVTMLRAQPRIDGGRIFVLGHSLGGMLVPRIAGADPSIAGFIVMAGAARPIEEAIVAQVRYIAGADGGISPEEQKSIDEATQLAERVRALRPEDAAGDAKVGNVRASYWLDLRGYDPPAAAKAVKSPMLILQGERDYQVTPAEFERWKAALQERRDVTFRLYPALNHRFMAGTGLSMPAEYLVPGHVAEEVVRDIAEWVLGRR